MADSLIEVARAADGVLREQGWFRRGAAETAAAEFSGAYARLFVAACVAESEDRGRLARVLSELAEQVEIAKRKAREEQDRQDLLAAWQVREADRERRRQQDGVLGTVSVSVEEWGDPRPSEVPVAAPVVSAAFAVTERARAGGASGATSSADPDDLRVFVTQSRGSNVALEREWARVSTAWASFVALCSWVPVGSSSFVGGFGRLLEENRADASWIAHVADAFEAAGSGALSNAMLDVVAAQGVSAREREAMLAAVAVMGDPRFMDVLGGALSPSEVAEWWASLGVGRDVAAQFPPDVQVRLASMDGLPAWVQDVASREFLTYALKNPEQAYELMGFEDPYGAIGRGAHPVSVGSDLTLTEFTEQLHTIRDALTAAEDAAEALEDHPVVQVLGFGSHDGALVAGISVGNVDTAAHVGVNVSGMGSGVHDLTSGNQAAHALYRTASKYNTGASFAVVNWVGYRSPTFDEVPFMERADAGAQELTGFLNGIAASRQQAGNPPERVNVYAHSFGSTVAVEAVKDIDVPVDIVATYGSAGVKNDTTIDDLHADRVYATHGPGDNVAELGRLLGEKTVDPVDLDGVVEFSSRDNIGADGSEKKGTTMHSMYVEEDEWAWNNWDGTVGYLSPGSTSLDRMGHMLANGTAK
ncbi:MAG: alpha/beta hydrolase [Actinomycetota bacterium]